MRPRARVTWMAALLCGCTLALLSSCATSRGSTLDTVLRTQQGTPSSRPTPSDKPPQPPAQSPPQSQKGLEISTDPSSAEVWIDGILKGMSPVVLTDIVTGWHRVVLKKQGYHDMSAWVDFNSDYMFYQATLTRITGFLQLSVTPPDAEVAVDGGIVSPGLVQLGVGTYTLSARLFGYTEYRVPVTIEDGAVTTVSIALTEAPFDVTSFSVPKQVVNPENPGFLATVDGRFSVTGPGTGEIRIVDSAGGTVLTRQLPGFTTWDQSFTWNVRDDEGNEVPDGTYRIILGAGAQGADSISRESTIVVDRTLKIAPHSVWSGASGLLYAPTADVLPPGDFQVGILGALISVRNEYLAPVQLGARLGMGSGFELNVSAGVIPSSVSLPVSASVAARWNMSTPHGDFGTASALQAKLAVQVVPGVTQTSLLMTDTFANFTGLSLELPLQLVLGKVSLLLDPGVTGSFWYPYSTSTDASFVAWMYLRAGVLLDLGELSAGVSVSTRTEPLPGGVAFLASPVPFQAGAEVHWLIPGTSIFVSGIVAGEYEDAGNYYFMGGGGLGFLY